MVHARPWAAVPSIAVLLISAVIVIVKFSGEAPIDSNIIHALPLAEHDRVAANAITRAAAAAGRQVIVVVRAEAVDTRVPAARALTARLQETGFFVPQFEQGSEIARWLFANRAELLCPEDERLLMAGEGAKIARDALATLVTPGSPVVGTVVAEDPFLLGYRLLRCLVPSAPEANNTVTIVAGRLNASPYRPAVQEAVDLAIVDWRRKWAGKGVTLDRSGVVFYAHAATARARTEISMIGGIGTMTVALVFWVTFRRKRAPILAVATVFAGVLPGLATCLVVFETISVMTLVFGAALVGIAVDYAIHYMMTAFTTEASIGTSRLRLIFRPLTTGMLTSICGFGALVLFASPVMMQIAVLATTGLLASWAFAVGVLPLLDTARRQPGGVAIGLSRIAQVLIAPKVNTTMARVGAVVIASAVVLGFSRLTIVDDVRTFQEPPVELRLEEERVKHLTGFQPRVQFLLSRGVDVESAKLAEEAALAILTAGEVPAPGKWLPTTTRFDPSKISRRRTRELLRANLFDVSLTDHARRLGLNPQDVLDRNAEVDQSIAYPEALTALRGAAAGEHYLIVPLTAAEAKRISARSAELLDGVRVVDPVAWYAATLRSYRQLSVIAFGVAAVICSIAVVTIYRRWSALRIVVPPVIAGIAACGILGLAGVPFSFFSGMALLVVLGTGIDFAVFQYEQQGRTAPWVLAAIFLAAMTSVLSMGLLALSATVPVSTFGLTVASGVLMSMLFSRFGQANKDQEAVNHVGSREL